MRLVSRDVAMPSRSCTFHIHHLTDLHIDEPGHASKALDRRIKEIADDPGGLWMGGGDYGSLIMPMDKRFEGDSSAEEFRIHQHRAPDYLLDRLHAKLDPIASKCIGLGEGNHETAIAKYHGRGIVAELAARLDVPDLYLGYRGWSMVNFVRGSSRKLEYTLSCYQHHGWSAGRLRGRKALQAERELGERIADVHFLGHDHQPYEDMWWTQETFLRPSGKGWGLRNRPRAFINGGAWVEERQEGGIDGLAFHEVRNSSWSERKNYRPQEPGGPILQVNLHAPSERGVEVEFAIITRGRMRTL